MSEVSVGKRLLFGALAGLAGSIVMQAALKSGQKAASQNTPPMREDPGKFMIQKAKQALPEKVS